MNLSMLLDMAASGFGERVVVGRREDGTTAGQLAEVSRGAAARLQEVGAEALIYLASNGPAYPVALFAAAYAGIPLVPLNYRLGSAQLTSLVRDPGASAVAIADDSAHALFDEIGVPVQTPGQWLTAAMVGSAFSLDSRDDGDAPAVVIYTSGTTSAPKGAVLRNRHLVGYVLGSVDFAAANADEASLVSVPPYHIAAVANAITNLYSGRRSVVLERFGGPEWIRLARDESISHAVLVPTMLSQILSADIDLSLPSLRHMAYGGAPMPTRVIERAMAVWPHVDFVNAYGLTETSSTIAVLGPVEHRAALNGATAAARNRLSSVGRPIPGMEIEIRDTATGVLDIGIRGRIWVRGEQVSGEYLGSRARVDGRGFFDTRDEGYLDDEGYLFVGGRADDTIIRGGENIAPAEIEEVLLKHPNVEDAVVVGIPDETWGERLEAIVVPLEGIEVDTEEIRAFARSHLRGSKTPNRS